MSLSVTYESLAGETGFYLGYGRSVSDFSAKQLSDVELILSKAMRMWYFPSTPGGLYRWSFLRKTSPITLIADQEAYDLPEDFGGLSTDCINFAQDARKGYMTRRSEDKLLTLFANAWASGDPRYYAIRQKGTFSTGRAQYELLLYPVPAEAVEISVKYSSLPAELSVTNPYPLGGEQHGETILAACLACAEQKMEDAPGINTANFQKLLEASMAIDADMVR